MANALADNIVDIDKLIRALDALWGWSKQRVGIASPASVGCTHSHDSVISEFRYLIDEFRRLPSGLVFKGALIEGRIVFVVIDGESGSTAQEVAATLIQRAGRLMASLHSQDLADDAERARTVLGESDDAMRWFRCLCIHSSHHGQEGMSNPAIEFQDLSSVSAALLVRLQARYERNQRGSLSTRVGHEDQLTDKAIDSNGHLVELRDYVSAAEARTKHVPDGTVLDNRKLMQFLNSHRSIRRAWELQKNGKQRKNRPLIHLGDWHNAREALMEWHGGGTDPIESVSQDEIAERTAAVRAKKKPPA